MNISTDERAHLYKELGIFRDTFREYLIGTLRERFGETWKHEVENLINPQMRDGYRNDFERNRPAERLVDFGQFKTFALKYKDILLRKVGPKAHNLPTWLDDITEIRNKVAHFDEVDEDAATKARINMRDVAKLLGLTELEAVLRGHLAPKKFPRSRTEPSVLPETDRLIEASVRRHALLSFQVNSGNEHRVMHSALKGSLWIKPRYSGYRVATTGQVSTIDEEIAGLVGPCDDVDNKGYKYWYLETSNTIDQIISFLGRC